MGPEPGAAAKVDLLEIRGAAEPRNGAVGAAVIVSAAAHCDTLGRRNWKLAMTEIRSEHPGDVTAIRVVNERAFGSPGEAELVEKLRSANKAVVSLVAQRGDQVVGHILFSPITVANAPGSFRGVGLAPMSVLPEFQDSGIGSRLVREGLVACRQAGYDIVVVLGHINYYPRFGFARAKDYGLDNEYDAADAFMVLELNGGALKRVSGLVKFAPEFQEAGC